MKRKLFNEFRKFGYELKYSGKTKHYYVQKIAGLIDKLHVSSVFEYYHVKNYIL